MFKIGDKVRYVGETYEDIADEAAPIVDFSEQGLILVDFVRKGDGAHFHGTIDGREGLWCTDNELVASE